MFVCVCLCVCVCACTVSCVLCYLVGFIWIFFLGVEIKEWRPYCPNTFRNKFYG